MAEIRTFAQLVDDIRAATGPIRLVGVDGFGAAGKTTFARRLADAAGSCPIVHTDDFATHDQPLDWWPRFQDDVVEPLLQRRPATFRPYDWVRRAPGESISVHPADVVVIEGVGATRAAWRDRLAMAIWIETDSDLRLRRGLERDGAELAPFWADWRLAEDRYLAEENPSAHADLVVAGDPTGVAHDPEREFVVISAPQRAEGVRPAPR